MGEMGNGGGAARRGDCETLEPVPSDSLESGEIDEPQVCKASEKGEAIRGELCGRGVEQGPLVTAGGSIRGIIARVPSLLRPSFAGTRSAPPISAVSGGGDVSSGGNGGPESPKPTRRGRKKSAPASSTPPSSSSGKKTKRASKTEAENGAVAVAAEPAGARAPEEEGEGGDDWDYDDGIDSYDEPPLVCCFGAAQREFVPTVRVHHNPMHPDIYSQWKMLQWDPPEFARAPGGPPSNVAISHVRLGGRAAFMGKVGRDSFGGELVLAMNKERVQTRAVKFDGDVKTGRTYMKVKFEGGRMRMETVKESAEDSLASSELNLAVLKEAKIFHFTSEVLTSPSMHATLFRAIKWSKKFGSRIFFDLNLPLPLWRSRDETRELIKRAWDEADIIEVSRQELEFLLDEDHYERKRNYRPQYYAKDFEQTKNRRDYYHYTREEIYPLWHDKLKFIFVTDGTLRIHYYTPSLMVLLSVQKMF
ncbi:hypothetical protein NL676_003082 [Syzygium grande]|nr:hypothetical protein NL676_003082 [Syzygium grande]